MNAARRASYVIQACASTLPDRPALPPSAGQGSDVRDQAPGAPADSLAEFQGNAHADEAPPVPVPCARLWLLPTIHRHDWTPWRERIRQGTWVNGRTGELSRGQIVERGRVCLDVGCRRVDIRLRARRPAPEPVSAP